MASSVSLPLSYGPGQAAWLMIPLPTDREPRLDGRGFFAQEATMPATAGRERLQLLFTQIGWSGGIEKGAGLPPGPHSPSNQSPKRIEQS